MKVLIGFKKIFHNKGHLRNEELASKVLMSGSEERVKAFFEGEKEKERIRIETIHAFGDDIESSAIRIGELGVKNNIIHIYEEFIMIDGEILE